MSGFGGSNWGFGSWGGSSFYSPVIDILLEDVISGVTDSVSVEVPLRVVQATSLSAYSVRIRFSEPIDPYFAPFSNPSNYHIPGLTVISAIISGPYSVILNTTPSQDFIYYTVTVDQGRDISGNLLETQNYADFLGFAETPYFLAGAISPTKVMLIFSTEMSEDFELTSTSNYSIRGGPGGLTIPVTSVTIEGGSPVRRVSLTLGTPLLTMGQYAVVVSSAVTSIHGQIVSPDTALFTWSDMAEPTRGHPLSIPISSFSGEVTGGLLGTPAGQVFFTPAYEPVSNTSTIELESVSVCTRAYDEYHQPSGPTLSPLYTFGGGGTLNSGFVTWGSPYQLNEACFNLSDYHLDDILPKVWDPSTGQLESPIRDTPATATLVETIDITRASFLNDPRWTTYPGDGGFIFNTADNMTPIGPGPTIVRELSNLGGDILGLIDSIGVTDEVSTDLS